MKQVKFSAICAFAMLLGMGAAFAAKASIRAKAGSSNYYVNRNNVATPTRTDLFSVSSDPSDNCDQSSQQICAVLSSQGPDANGNPPSGASYSSIATGSYAQ